MISDSGWVVEQSPRCTYAKAESMSFHVLHTYIYIVFSSCVTFEIHLWLIPMDASMFA